MTTSDDHVDVVRSLLETTYRELSEERAMVRGLARQLVELEADRDAEAALADQAVAALALLDTDLFLSLGPDDTLHDDKGQEVFWTGGEGSVLFVAIPNAKFPLDQIEAALAAHRERRTKEGN